MGRKAATRKPWASFPTDVVVGRREEDALALGTPVGDHFGIPLHEPVEVQALSVRAFADAWTSASGTAYLVSDEPDQLVVRADDGWSRLVIPGAPSREGTPVCITGRSGVSAADDELFVAIEVGAKRDVEGLLMWRRDGAWHRSVLGPGRVWALAAATQRERGLYVSTGPGPEDATGPRILRVHDGALTPVPLPEASVAHGWGATALALLPDGALFACLAEYGTEQLGAWTFDHTTWRPVAMSHPARGWLLDHVGCVVWRDRLHLATADGIFDLERDATGDRLVRRSDLLGISLWPLDDALVCRGWRDGESAHEIHRGDGWEPFLVPDPDTVRGGRGKAVWLPPRRKVPVRKVRMPVVVAAAPTLRSADDTSFGPVFAAVAGATRREPPVAYVSLADDFGTTGAHDLRALLSVFAEVAGDGPFGSLRPWSGAEPLPLPSPGRAITELYDLQPAVVGLFTDTVPIGRDAGGQVYHARVSPEASEVFLFGPGVGDLVFLADSVSAFLYANQLLEHWHRLARERDLDLEDVIQGDVDLADPAIAAIGGAVRALDGRVHLGDLDADVTSDLDETLIAIAGVAPNATTAAPTRRVFEAAQWLIMALGGDGVDPAPALGRELEREHADAAWWEIAGVRIYWLWHLYLFGRDAELATLADELASDPAARVRDTAAMLRELAGPRRERPGELARFTGLRAVVCAASDRGARYDPVAAAPHLARSDADDDHTTTCKRALASEPTRAERWDQLLYAYYQRQRFVEMAAAARVRISLAPNHYYPWLQLGIALQATDQLEQAIASYGRALVYRSYDGSTWFNLATVYAKWGDARASVALLRQALRFNPEYAQTVAESPELAALAEDPAFRALMAPADGRGAKTRRRRS